MIKCCCKYDSATFLQILVTCMNCVTYRGNVEDISSYFVSKSFSRINVLRVVIVCANPSRQYIMATGHFILNQMAKHKFKVQIANPSTGFVANRFVAVLLLASDVVLIPWKFSTIIWPEWYAGHSNLLKYQDASGTQVIEKQKPSSGTAFTTDNFEQHSANKIQIRQNKSKMEPNENWRRVILPGIYFDCFFEMKCIACCNLALVALWT